MYFSVIFFAFACWYGVTMAHKEKEKRKIKK
jgi:hypothetical protein